MTVKKALDSSRRKAPKPLNIEDFRYLDQIGLALPQLILGVRVPQSAFNEEAGWRELSFKPGRKWLKIAHQHGGVMCHQSYYIATILEPHNNVQIGMERLQSWPLYGGGLDGVVEYRNRLKEIFDADCNGCYKELEAAHYPIDVAFAPKLAKDVLPPDLDELVDWSSGMERACGCIGRWHLTVLTTNSD